MYLYFFTYISFFITFIFCTSCASTKIHDVQFSESGPNIKISKEIKPSTNIYILKEGEYFAKLDQCSILWQVNEFKDTKNIKIFYPQHDSSYKCSIPFKNKLSLYQELLRQITNDWEKSRITSFCTSSFESLNFPQAWSETLALASHESLDWNDYKKNYPRHKGNNSSNDILVKIVNEKNIYQELANLFLASGLELKLSSVEKVFALPLKDLPFKESLKTKGVPEKARLIYDAGTFCYKLKLIAHP